MGNSYGGPVGGALGGELGSAAGDYFAKLTGFGDYTVRQNSLFQSGALTSVPRFGSSKVRIRHVEFIGDVKGSMNFVNTPSQINPGNQQMFPWLSNIAQHYEKWKPHGLVYVYRSTSGSATGSDTTLGTVVMATNYDVKDADFVSKREMEAYEFCTSGGPDHDAIHPVECRASSMPLRQYIVSTQKDPPDDPRFHHLGNFQIATVGQPINNATLGELWVAYDIELSTPKLSPDVVSSYWHAYGDVASNKHIMKDPYVYPGSSSNIWLHDAGVLGQEAVHFQHTGYYMITLNYVGSYNSRDVGWTPGNGVTDITNVCGFWADDPGIPFVGNVGTPGGKMVSRIIVHVSQANSRVSIGTINTSATPDSTLAFIEVSEIPASMINALSSPKEHPNGNHFVHVLQSEVDRPALRRSDSKSSGTRTPSRR